MRIPRSIVLTVALLTVATFVVGEAGEKIIIPFATSGFAPALTGFNGRMHIAWTKPYEIRIALSPNGIFWTNDHGLGETSAHGPALAAFNNRLYIAWTGTDKDSLLNVKSAQDGENFGGKVPPLPYYHSFYGPALAVFNNRLYLAWTDEKKSLNLVWSTDGVNFPPANKINLGQPSIAGPALMSTPRGWPSASAKQRLFITWTGPDQGMNIASSDDGVHFDLSSARIPRARATSNDRPVLFPTMFARSTPDPSSYPVMYLYFTGTDARLNQIFTLSTTPTGADFDPGPTALGGIGTVDDTSIAGPAIYNGYVAWTGTDDAHHLNVKSSIPQW
jgi:hypothetical protein